MRSQLDLAGRLNRLPPDSVARVVDGSARGDGQPAWAAPFVALAYGAGVTQNEAFALRRGDYRPREGLVVVPARHRVQNALTVDWRAREVPLLARVRAALDAYLSAIPHGPDDAPLFRLDSSQQRPRNMVALTIAKAMDGVGLPGIDSVRLCDAFVRAVWALDRGQGHGQCLIGLARDQFVLGRRAFELPSVAELAGFLDAAHPWGGAKVGRH